MIKIYKDDIFYDNLTSLTYPDGTPLMISMADELKGCKVTVNWSYASDSELFRLMCFVRDLQSKGVDNIELYLPYIPNARMDRVYSDEDLFTLKYFAEFINSLNFKRVKVLDAHSDVSVGLIDRCYNISPISLIESVLKKLNFDASKGDLIVYPDAGCKKRLDGKLVFPSVFCNKRRDWKTGIISGTDVYGYEDLGITESGEVITSLKGARILFVDDICAYGGTAKYTLRELNRYGVSECYCYFTHIEKAIFGKEDWKKTGVGAPILLTSGLVDKIFCTDSLVSEDYINSADKHGVGFEVLNVR